VSIKPGVHRATASCAYARPYCGIHPDRIFEVLNSSLETFSSPRFAPMASSETQLAEHLFLIENSRMRCLPFGLHDGIRLL